MTLLILFGHSVLLFGAFLPCCFGALLTERDTRFLWQMSDRALFLRGPSGFFDVPPRRRLLVCGGHRY
jgi:hypothetical protein